MKLYAHPFSSYCQKVLIALYENDVPFDYLNLEAATVKAELASLWPLKRFPVLVDQGRTLIESSTIIEYLQCAHPGPHCLVPAGEDGIEVHMLDRLFDNYVMTPMQALTAALLQPASDAGGATTAAARATLLNSYALLDRQVDGRRWLAGEAFTLADCAAAPALFYAVAYVPVPDAHAALSAYVERLMAHTAVAAVIDAARPWFKHFPGRAGLARRYYDPDA